MPKRNLPRAAAIAAAFLVSTASWAAPYAGYEQLIGEWATGPRDKPAQAVIRFGWAGGLRSHIVFSAATLSKEGREVPHFDGILVWNGVRQNLDMLLSLDPAKGAAQEQGALTLQPDGSYLREITAFFSPGARLLNGQIVGEGGGARAFRQTLRFVGPDEIETTLLTRTAAGWVADFPGSNQLVMRRRVTARR